MVHIFLLAADLVDDGRRDTFYYNNLKHWFKNFQTAVF